MDFSDHPFRLRQLQYAVAVADSGGFRRAAERCGVSQPSLSAQIANLEAAVGDRLFERGRRGVRLTPTGSALIPRARDVLLAADDLVEATRAQVGPLSGTIRIGVLPTIGPYLLPDVDPAIRKAFPELALQWTEGRIADLSAALHRGEIDTALVAQHPALSGLATAEVTQDPLVLATSLDHPLAQGHGPVALGHLRTDPVLLLEDGHALRDQALTLCRTAGAQEPVFQATSLATLVQMVSAGHGITLLPTCSLEVLNRRGCVAIRPFLATAPNRTLVLAWRKGASLAPAIRRMAAAGH